LEFSGDCLRRVGGMGRIRRFAIRFSTICFLKVALSLRPTLVAARSTLSQAEVLEAGRRRFKAFLHY
jgi:hypothetical protein